MGHCEQGVIACLGLVRHHQEVRRGIVELLLHVKMYFRVVYYHSVEILLVV